MRKLVFAICKQRCRSVYASVHLISTFAVPFLGSIIPAILAIIPILAKSKLSRPLLVSMAEQVSLSLAWSQIAEGGFSRDMADLI